MVLPSDARRAAEAAGYRSKARAGGLMQAAVAPLGVAFVSVAAPLGARHRTRNLNSYHLTLD
jgi:hypothetical protein